MQNNDESPVKQRKSRSRKDPRAPKRSKSAYIFFAIENRESVKAEIGNGARVGDIAKLTSQRWRSLSDKERSHWDALSRADRDRYQEEKEAYTGPRLLPNDSDNGKKRRQGKQHKKDPAAPKRPLTAFLYFSQQLRPTLKERNPSWRVAELSQELGRMWREMSEQDREPYTQYVHGLRDDWLIEKEKYKREHDALVVTKNDKEERKKLREQEKKLLKQQSKEERQRKREEAASERSAAVQHLRPQGQPSERRHRQQQELYAHDRYRQQLVAQSDNSFAGMRHYADANVFAGMISQQDQEMMSLGYPGGIVGPSSVAYQQAQQHVLYGDPVAAGRYAAGLGSTGMGLIGHHDLDPGLGAAGMAAGLGGYGPAIGAMGGGMPSMGMYGKRVS